MGNGSYSEKEVSLPFSLKVFICFSAHNEANDHDGHDQADGVKSLLSLYTSIASRITFSTAARFSFLKLSTKDDSYLIFPISI